MQPQTTLKTKRRHRYYAYLRKSDGALVWMTRETHLMLLKYPSWISRFQVSTCTGESRLLTPEDFLRLRCEGRTKEAIGNGQ